MAEQEEPVRRKVALKIIKPGMDSKQVVARFEVERQALAMMDHTNIARVFDAGATESGRPYFVMELVHGVPITTYCDENVLTPRQRLELFVPVCQAIQHAHLKGIIHRDVKPSNILVTMYDDRPVPKVIDFGVAKAVEQRLTEKSLFTQYGTLVGTFEYMSPEQAEMNAFGVDTRSDIYSLGVLLYELLTGTTPLERTKLREAAYGEIVRLIKEEEPPRPSVRLSTSGALAKVAAARKTEPGKLSRLVRGELDWIVMRCLEKGRERRYETASGLARDIERYLGDEPVEARPPSAGYRLRKFARRHGGPVAAGVTIAALVVLGAAFSIWQSVRATHAEHEAVVQRDEATEKRDEAETAREQLRHTLYAAHLNLAQAAWEGDRIGDVLKLLNQEKAASPDLCGFEWHYWMRQCHANLWTLKLPGLGPFFMTAFSADGTRVISLIPDPTKPRAYKIWDTASGKEVASFPLPTDRFSLAMAPSADGTRLAISIATAPRTVEKAAHELVIVDATTGRRLVAMSGVAGEARGAAFSSDGKQVAALVIPHGQPDADATRGELNIWDAATGERLQAIPVMTGGWLRPAFSPDGARIAVVLPMTNNQFESEVKLWDIATGKLLASLPAAIDGSWSSVAFSPDGEALAAVGNASSASSALHVWDIASGRPRFTIRMGRGADRYFGPLANFVSLAFSPDSRRITCASGDPRVGLWDAANGKELAMYRGHRGDVSAVAFSADGRQILSADRHGAVKVWDANPHGEPLVLNPGGLPMHTVVSPDAQRIATLAYDSGVVKVWDVTGKQLLSLKRSTARDTKAGFGGTLVFSPKGDRLACGTSNNPPSDGEQTWEKGWGGLTVWDDEGKELLKLEEEGVRFTYVSLSPDGTRVAAGVVVRDSTRALQWTVRIWDIATGRQILAIQPSAGLDFSVVTFSPDGTRLATVAGGRGQPSRIVVWDAATGAECGRWQVPAGWVTSVASSPDGRRVAATITDMDFRGELIVGDLVSGGLMNLGHARGSVTFSPDGTRLAAHIGSPAKPVEVGLWDAGTGRQLLVLKGHTGVASGSALASQGGLAFSPSGDRIISTGNPLGANAVEVKIWDATPLPGPGQP
jgi:WD40 repeat protein